MEYVDFTTIAREVFKERVGKGTLKELDQKPAQQIINDYKEWLQSYVTTLIYEELERLGKIDEFSKSLKITGSNRDAYLNQIIPNYKTFLLAAVQKAKAQLLA
jgi:hypothetical protein